MALITATVFSACSGHTSSSAATLPPPGHPVAVSKHGVGCTSFAFPSKVGPPSYLATDIGQSDVPRLTQEQSNMLHRIQQFVHSPSLRFAFIENDYFIVFDAPDGPCLAVGGYRILNSVNGMYEPGDNPFTTHGASADNLQTPGPWMNPH